MAGGSEVRETISWKREVEELRTEDWLSSPRTDGGQVEFAQNRRRTEDRLSSPRIDWLDQNQLTSNSRPLPEDLPV